MEVASLRRGPSRHDRPARDDDHSARRRPVPGVSRLPRALSRTSSTHARAEEWPDAAESDLSAARRCRTTRSGWNILWMPAIRRVIAAAPGGDFSEVTTVQEARPVGPAGQVRDDAEDLLVFIERLAAAGQGHRATQVARERIAEIVRGGSVPPGVRRLAEALAATMSDVAPAPRQPADASLEDAAQAMRTHPLVVLDEATPAAVAAAVTALIEDGRRVVVAAETTAELDAVRGDVAGPVLDALPALDPAELRELRRLQATSTSAGRARPGQRLPAAALLPVVGEVERLCAQAVRASADRAGTVVPTVLAGVEPERREAVTAIARCVSARLEALGPQDRQPWRWELLGHLIHSRHRGPFDRCLEETAQAVPLLRMAGYSRSVQFLAPLPPEAVDLLCDFQQFLADGGRTRRYFPTSLQREVGPVLRIIRIDGREPESSADVLRVIGELELQTRMRRIEASCVEMRVPPPHRPEDLAGLESALQQVGAAARSVGALRHDVLFLRTDSPLQVPDVESAARVATAILDYAENGSAGEAARELDGMAADLAGRAPAEATAPEHEQAVEALRRRDAAAYAAAVDALGAARRQQRDELRRTALLDVLRTQAPAVAEAWDTARPGATSGLACFVPSEALLRGLPGPDSADVVVVLGAARLGVERLLLAAVAPRLIAVVSPDEPADEPPTMLSVLQRAAAPVLRAARAERPEGRVVPFAPSSRSGSGPSAVRQAGA